MEISIAGKAVPRFSRSAIAGFTREALAAIRRAKGATTDADEVSIVFVGDDEMKSLNRKYRGKNKTTDVLTFPAEDDDSPGGSRQLGDIVISIDQAKRQAADEGHSLAAEVRYLIVHGLLHAYGHDHETDDGAMNALEMKVRARVGLE